MEGPEIQFAEAVIDNGDYGTRTVRFETGRLAKQASGSAFVMIDEETSMLSATSVGKNPREGFDFFPLTVDVEERQYAAGKIPGSFFRREGRPSTEDRKSTRLNSSHVAISYAVFCLKKKKKYKLLKNLKVSLIYLQNRFYSYFAI